MLLNVSCVDYAPRTATASTAARHTHFAPKSNRKFVSRVSHHYGHYCCHYFYGLLYNILVRMHIMHSNAYQFKFETFSCNLHMNLPSIWATIQIWKSCHMKPSHWNTQTHSLHLTRSFYTSPSRSIPHHTAALRPPACHSDTIYHIMLNEIYLQIVTSQ